MDRSTRPPIAALGLMSGTSLDGVDAAILITDGEAVLGHGPAATFPYPATFREALRRLLGRRPVAGDEATIRELDACHLAAVRAVLGTAGAPPVRVVGYHGQTVWHRPQAGETVQVGCGARLADALGIAVVNDFRSADVAAGGEGAPLVPLYHRALARPLPRPLAIVNVGGVANVTWLGSDEAPVAADGGAAVLAFDSGPGNALIDDWVRQASGLPFDDGGRMAGAGRVREALIRRWLDHPYFSRPAPKSLDRDAFAPVLAELKEMSAEDGAATLTAFTAAAIARGRALLPEPPRRWLITGGGRHNRVLMRMMGERLGAEVAAVETVGWRGDVLEAEAFAFLAVRSLYGLPLSLPSTTGVRRPQRGGRLNRPAASG